MTVHKHAEMIKAKADNMDLVVFCRDSYDIDNPWCETSQLPIQDEFDYFLCLPRYKKECLHWLNGGLASCNTSSVVEYLLPHSEYKWSTAHHFMCDGELLELIKP